MPQVENKKKALTFQELLFTLQRFWAEHGCVLQQPYDLEVGAGTMSPDTFLRVLGPKPISIAYAQPSRRPADGRYGENPNRLFRHTQLQVILKPPPERVQELYLESLVAIGIDLKEHDIKFEEDNWEWPVGGAWGVGWQVMLDGQEITQFTYFQQCGGMDLDPISGEITYGLERIAQFLQDLDSIYDIVWSRDPVTGAELTYGDVRLHEEQQFSAYSFDYADVDKLWEHLRLYEAECLALLDRAKTVLKEENEDALAVKRFPVMGAYELALKCSHTFNLLDARGAISVTERVGVMARIRNLIVGVAKIYAEQQRLSSEQLSNAKQQIPYGDDRKKNMADFLFEIGLEEVPARMIPAAEAELLRRTLALLGKEALLPEEFDPLKDAVSYSTPRRLAVLVRGVREQQADITEETTGPAVKIAFKDGVPTPAAEAFARKAGIPITELRTITTPKGEYLAATSVKKGRSAAEVIAGELPKEVGAIYWAKSMYWRPGKPERFVRPVLWIVCLLGESVVPLTFAGKTAGRASYGHRVLSSGEPFEIVAPESYLAQLEGEYVIADVEARRHKIRKALDHVTRKVAGARWREDEALVDSVTHLTEWPAVLLGGFEAAYLELPEEVLVTVMRDHQKYFAVEDAGGKLAPHFLAVLNIELDATNEPIIKQGNERVLRARFNDARFFWEFDQRTPLVERVKLLENVTFQKDLGSYAAKSDRVRALAAQLASVAVSRGAVVDAAAVGEAAKLAKTDLTTELVKEFTELQGIIGGLYAKTQGASATVADAIYDQYLPASAKDAIPRSAEGAVLGLADRIDTISGMFALGMEPTGSKDPFALRRAANAVVRILVESGLPLTLKDVLWVAETKPEVAAKLQAFFAERIEFYLREGRGQAYDVVKAVVAAGSDDLRDVVARAEAVTSVRGGEDFIAVSAAFKRMKNILDQARAKGESIPTSVSTALLSDESEKALESTGGLVASDVESLRAKRQYNEALAQVASLRPVVNEFFEKVMVMAPEPDIRANRLALLARTVADFSRIADFSEIVVQG